MQHTWAPNHQPVGNTTCFTVYGTACRHMNQQLQTLPILSMYLCFLRIQKYDRGEACSQELPELWERHYMWWVIFLRAHSDRSRTKPKWRHHLCRCRIMGFSLYISGLRIFMRSWEFYKGTGSRRLWSYMGCVCWESWPFLSLKFQFSIWFLYEQIIFCSLELPNKEMIVGKSEWLRWSKHWFNHDMDQLNKKTFLAISYLSPSYFSLF